MSFLCLAADEDQLIIPVDVALADAQQRIQPDAGVVEDLKRAKPEPGGSDACAIASAALGADLHVEPIAGAQDGFGCDGFACSPGGDDGGLSERVDLGVCHQLVLDGIAPDRSQMIRIRVPAPLRQALFQDLAPPSQHRPVVHLLYGCRRAEVLEQRLGRGAVDLRAGFSEIVREDVLLGELLRRHSTPPSASVMTVRLGLSRGCTGNSSLGSWSR